MTDLAILAAIAALPVAALLAFLIGRRTHGGADVTAEVTALSARMDALARDVVTALEQTREESRRSRVVGELGGTIDLDEVLARTLDAAGAIPGVDAAAVTVDGPEPTTATIGLGDGPPDGPLVVGPPDSRHARTVRFDYAYSTDEIAGDGGLIHSGVAVPLVCEGERLGYLAVYSRTPGSYLDDDRVRELEELALRAGPAVENARRFREARQLADLDALTNLHNRRYFHETLEREVARAQRYNRNLALIVLDLDDFKAVNDRVGHLAGDEVLVEAADRVREVVRTADIACRIGGDEFAVILPESGVSEADALFRRLETALSQRPIAPGARLMLSAGIAELRAEDDAVAFFQRADAALYRAKAGGKGMVVADGPARTWPRTTPGQP